MELPEECDFEPATVTEAFLQQEIKKIQAMPDWLCDLVDSGDLEPMLMQVQQEDLRLAFYRLRQDRRTTNAT